MCAEGLVHVAYGKAAAAVGTGPNTAQFTQLSSKVETLIRTYLQVNVFPDISKRVSMLHGKVLVSPACMEAPAARALPKEMHV